MWYEGSVISAKIILDIQIVVSQPNIVIFMHFLCILPDTFIQRDFE